MTKQEIKNRIEKLKKTINHYRYLYHVLDREEIPESALDSLKKELFDLEQQFPEFITHDSPTQRVGGKALKEFKKFKHPFRMLSFNDAFSRQDMENWKSRFSKLLTSYESSMVEYYCEPKLDGLAIELVYEDGFLKVGSTRGDGLMGEDVTQNLKTVEAIPLRLSDVNKVVNDLRKEGLSDVASNITKNGLRKVVVRGEIIITKEEFERINKEQKKLGFPAFANPRNLAAGSVRQLDPKIMLKRRLDENTYSLMTDFGQKSHEQAHLILHVLGFKTNNKYTKHCKNLDEVFDYHDFWYKNREKLPYEIDGVVVQVDDNKIFKELGVVGKAPRAAIAFKFPLKQTTTTVEDIKVQIGRTGAMTPVAILKPVEIGGVTISRATLHNEDEVKRLGLKIGDTVIVGRAGDVIPDVIRVLPEMRMGKEKEFKMPENCPSCGSKLVKQQNEVLWRCENSKNCLAQQRECFYHFVSKGAFNIDGLGPKIIDRLLDEGLLYDTADIFNLEKMDVSSLERFGEKSAQNLISSIQSKKNIFLKNFIYALGIRNVGEETSIDLARKFGKLDKLKNASISDLEDIADIGQVVSKSIYNFFREKNNLKLIEKLEKVGVKIIPEKRQGFHPLKGFSFVLTGTLESMSRELAKEKIVTLGGKTTESVSKNTDYVVIGREPGSKYKKAQAIGVKTITEKEFLKMIK